MALVKIGSSPANQTLSQYSVTEDSTPVDISDTSGGVSQITFTIQTPDNWKSLRKQEVTLTDESQGITTGIINAITDTGSQDWSIGQLAVTADSQLVTMNVTRTAQPYNGTLGGAIAYYFGLVSISGVVVDSTLASVPVTFQGWSGNVYLYVTKMLGPAFGFEVSLVGTNVVCRPFRGREAVSYRDSGQSETIDAGNAAQTVLIDYYPSSYKTNSLAYPPGGWTPDVTVYQVDAGAILTVSDIQMDASLSSVQQPTCVLNVGQYYASSSVYAIAGNDGLPITPAQWAATGGSLVLTINDDTKSLKMVLTGSNISQYAPYRVAMSSGASNYYSSLRIVGTGVFSTKQQLTLTSTLTTDVATQLVGTEVDSPFITSLGQAYDKGIWTLAHYSALEHTISISSAGINRSDDNGSYSYPTIAAFDLIEQGNTIAQFDTAWSGQTIQQFNDYWNATVSGTFENQAFGNMGGARVQKGDAYFRIRSATNSNGLITYTAEVDTTVADFDSVWSGSTIAQFDAFWASQPSSTISDFDVAPLLAPVVPLVSLG